MIITNHELIIMDLNRLREVKQQILPLEIEKKLLEENLHLVWFDNHTVFEFNGRILATCKEEKRTLLDSTKIKTELPDIWNQYSYQSISKPIRLK